MVLLMGSCWITGLFDLGVFSVRNKGHEIGFYNITSNK